jgi:hypothetical protein
VAVLISLFFKRWNSSACICISDFASVSSSLKDIEGRNSESFSAISEKSNTSHRHWSSAKFVFVIFIAFPFNAKRNSRKMEKERETGNRTR